MKPKNLIFVTLFLLGVGLSGLSQLFASEIEEGYSKFSFSIHGGPLISYTDVKPNSFFNSASESLTFGGGLGLNYHLSPALSLQSRFTYGQLEGLQERRNLMFRADIYEAAINARLSLNTLLNPLSPTNQWMNFYATLGAGVLLHESELLDSQSGDVIRWPYQGREGVSQGDIQNAFVIPFGLGLNFKISERIDIGIESTMAYAFTDELDANVVRGSRKDMYNYTSAVLTFRLGRNTRSKAWAPPYAVMYPGDQSQFAELNEQMISTRDEISATSESLGSEIETIKGELEVLSDQQAELNRRNTQISGSLEDMGERLLELQTTQEKEPKQQADMPDRFYTVQVMAHKQDISIGEARAFLNINFEIEKLHVGGWYKFYSGRYNKIEDAKLRLVRIWEQGVKDAFIVEYKDGTLTPR